MTVITLIIDIKRQQETKIPSILKTRQFPGKWSLSFSSSLQVGSPLVSITVTNYNHFRFGDLFQATRRYTFRYVSDNRAWYYRQISDDESRLVRCRLQLLSLELLPAYGNRIGCENGKKYENIMSTCIQLAPPRIFISSKFLWCWKGGEVVIRATAVEKKVVDRPEMWKTGVGSLIIFRPKDD